jgi:GNAT superfamily N-acetyltransferase
LSMIENFGYDSSKGLTLVIEKHGDHDQSSHGSWAHGVEVAPEIVRSTLERVKENGGLSVSLKDGSEPTKGFMVAKGKKFAAIVKADDFFDEAKGAEILSSYMKKHKSEFNNSNNYLGLWHNTDDGQVYLDVSENIKDEGEAISRGRDRDQISIWDVANFKEIETGGTGGIEKTRSSRTARYVQHDGRTDRRLRQRDLGEVSKTLKVIYFDYGLKPVFKHEGGPDHDQADHGNWATGRSKEDVERIAQMKDRGPSLEELDNAMGGGDSEIDPDKAEMMIDNDSYLNSEIETRIEDKIAEIEAKEGKTMDEHEKMVNYDSWREQAIQEYIAENADMLEQYSRDYGYGSLKDPEVSEGLRESFQEVYGVEVTSDRQGDPITLRSEVEEVYVDGDGIHVKSNVFNEDGDVVTTESIHRVFSKDEESGTWSVEHKLLEIEEDYRGLGFGGKFLQQSEDWYISQGVTHIVLNAGLEDGARHWANAGFDWNRDELPFIADVLESAIESRVRRIETGNSGLMSVSATKHRGELEEATALLGRMRDSDGNIKDMKNDDFPKPADFARLGAKSPLVADDGSSTWTGKELLRGVYTPYVKVLTAEGSNLLAGPIDMDGDGLIYDGTPREKPVSGSGNK